MVCWSLSQPHQNERQTPPSWCIHKSHVSHHPNITDVIFYHKLVRHKMGQVCNCQQHNPSQGKLPRQNIENNVSTTLDPLFLTIFKQKSKLTAHNRAHAWGWWSIIKYSYCHRKKILYKHIFHLPRQCKILPFQKFPKSVCLDIIRL
jgi:hypothetical protein